jgi:hypothetical protein
MAIYIYSEEQEPCKYPARTYVSPKDYPSTHYASLEAVQHARNSWGQPTFVTYADSMEWSKGEEVEKCSSYDQSGASGNQTGYGYRISDNQSVIDIGDQSMSGGVNSYSVSKGGNPYNEYMTGSTRMRNCENGTVDQSIYSSRAYNSGGLWAHNPHVDGCENISAV